VRDHGRYLRLDNAQRAALLAEWNRPVWWPMALIAAVLAAGVLIARNSLRRRERTNARGEILV
jgi:lipopolysaccharide export LptBFGC system permease protein LptF